MLLSFKKTTKIRTTEEHNERYSSDCYVPGTYVPNMSEEDNNKWKAKHIHGEDERIEIRKAIQGVQMVVIVYKQPNEYTPYRSFKNHSHIKISANGKIDLTLGDWEELKQAIAEAQSLME